MTDSDLQETLLSKEVIQEGIITRMEHWTVRLPNGDTAIREVSCHPGAAAVVALDPEDRVILVRQMRVAVGRITLEIPAGKFDHPGEDPLECAKRELSEETGMKADSWRKLTVLETTPGFCNERIHIFLASGLHSGSRHPDPDEFVDTLRMPLDEACAHVMDGSFHDGKTCLGLLMAQCLRASQTQND